MSFSAAVLMKDQQTAQDEIDFLAQAKVPLLKDYGYIFDERRIKQKELINQIDEIDGDAIKYHLQISYACSHIQDASCFFWGRGFLLSDLQFLSF